MLAPLIVVPFLMGAAATDRSDAEAAFRLLDGRIDESSGLVALADGRFVTVNDSGDSGRVFVLDDTGATVGVTSWDGDPTDVEALAPAGPGEVWVGDTGDNQEHRDHIEVLRVRVAEADQEVDPEVYDLVYPDGAHDAESLFAGPDGRLYVITKSWGGGTVYAAPATLDPTRDNRLEQVGTAGSMLAMATDAALLDDGHLIVRGYVSASLYEWPSLQRLASTPLPAQQQGEGLAVGPDGDLYLSSEGIHAEVLRLPVSSAFGGVLSPSPSATPTREPGSSQPTARPENEAGGPHRPWWPWLLGGAVGVAMIGVLIRSLRPR